MRLKAPTTSFMLTLLVLAALSQPTESILDIIFGPFDWINNQVNGFLKSACTGRNNIFYWTLSLSLLFETNTYISIIDPRRTPGDNGIINYGKECVEAAVTSASIEKRLGEMMDKFAAGTITRPNNLGLLRFSDQPFTCYQNGGIYSDGYCGIGLGQPEQDHSAIRPFLDYAFGNGGSTAFGSWVEEGTFWSFEGLKASAQTFIGSRTKLRLGTDAGAFYLTEMHKLILDIDLSSDEVYKMIEFFLDFVQRCTFPDIPFLMDTEGLRNQRAGYVTLYEDAILARNGLFNVNPTKITLAAESLLDALMFAALPSLTGATEGTLGAYLNGFVGDGIDWSSTHDIGRVIHEVVRIYPPVLGVAYLEDGYNYNSLAGYAGYDKTVWGDDAHSFRVRGDLDYYRNLQLSWADAAIPAPDRAHASHVCPAKSLSFNLLVAFIEALNVPDWEAPGGRPPEASAPGQGPFFWPEFDVIRIG